MSGSGERTPPARPATARPRTDASESDAGAPPTQAELEAIEWERIRWAALLGASVERDDALDVTFASYQGRRGGLNFAAQVRWPGEFVQQRLATLVRQMQAAGVWPQVVVCDGLTQPADLSDHLRTAGWIPIGAERIMWTRHASVVPHLDPGLRVEAVTRATALDVARLEAVSFELDPRGIDESAQLLAVAVESGATRGFLVRLAGEAVASARLMAGEPGGGVASLHAIGVAERHRRRGYGRLITAIATRAGLATGHRLVWLSVDADNAAAIEMYRGLAFDFTFTWSRWLAPAG